MAARSDGCSRGEKIMLRISDHMRTLKRIVTGVEIPRRKLAEFAAREKPAAGSIVRPGSCTSLGLVIPCFGHARYLADMFASIAHQTRLPDRVIFVDDASPDDSSVQLERLISGLPQEIGQRFTVLENTRNLGQAASLNHGISKAECDLIMILNDDDYLLHDAVQVMLDLFGRNPQLVLIGGHSLHFRGADGLPALPKTISEFLGTSLPQLDIRSPEDALTYRTYNDLNMSHSGSCFLKSAWSAVGGYQPVKSRRIVPFSDRDFQLRINALFPIGISSTLPFACWRADSSVDAGRDS